MPGIWTAQAARRIVDASSAVNAFVSRWSAFLGSVTFTLSNGLAATRRSPTAHANTLRAAFSHTSFTVEGLRSGVTSFLAHSRASSSAQSITLLLVHLCCRSRNTERHRFTVAFAGCDAFTHASNSAHGDMPLPGLTERPLNFGNCEGLSSVE